MRPSFENKIILIFSVIIFSVLALAFTTHRTNKVYENTTRWVHHTQEVLNLSEQVFSNVKDIERASRGFIITGDQEFLEPFTRQRTVVFTYLDSLRSITSDNPAQQKRIDSLKLLTEKKLHFTHASIAARTSQGLDSAKKTVASKLGLDLMNEIEQVVERIEGEEERLLEIREKANAKAMASFQLFFAILTLVLLLIIVGFAVVLSRTLRARKKAERQLLESKQLLQSVIDNTSSFIYVKDKEGRYQLVNKGYLQFLNRNAGEVIGKTDFDLFPAEMAQSIHRFEQEVLEQKIIMEKDEAYTYNGRMNHFLSVKFPLRGASGEILGTGGVITDITNVILEQRLQRQKEIAANTIEAQEKQRSEIGKELHDNIQQILASTNLMIGMAISNEEMRQFCLDKSKELILSAIREVRSLSHKMITPLFDERPLTEAIEEMAEDINMAGGVYALVSVADAAPVNALGENIKLALYRITQEQVSNILKYADASEMEIELKVAANTVFLTITDNGRGFDPRKQAKGVGLKNIASRAEVLDGKMEIISSPGKGCTLQVAIPV